MSDGPQFRGLFIGIDRYQSRDVKWLSGAVRDAKALHALFSDTLGDSAVELLENEHATVENVKASLKKLAESSTANDIVVVGYAGHGSDDHRLVLHDSEPAQWSETTISLEEFSDLVSEIPALHLACLLDCCFSGGIGARVFSTGVRTRAPLESVDKSLQRFTQKGRIAFTASASNEEAHESSKHGHGLFTYRLLEALQGAPEVVKDGTLDLYKLVSYVAQKVADDARSLGKVQTPTLRGQLDGAPRWPIFKTGTLYATEFPERVRQPAAKSVHSLAGFGFPADVLNTWASAISELNDLQVSAINDFGILDGKSVVVTAPTSSGKTMVGELAALHGVCRRQRAIFLLPMKALVNDKHRQFTEAYGPLGIRTIRATGEHSDDIPALMRGQFDIALLTYEKFTALILGSSHILDMASVVVIDEVQMIVDKGRGSNLEFMLTLLNQRAQLDGSPQIVALSGVVGDLGGLERWLGGRQLLSTTRPVPLLEGVLHQDGSYRYIDEAGNEQVQQGFIAPGYDSRNRRLVVPLVTRLVEEGKKVLVFRQSKSEAVHCAKYLSEGLGLPAADDLLRLLPSQDLSISSVQLQQTLSGGVGFHSSDLDRDERALLENEFRDPTSPLRVLVATPTLAMGVNTPASAVVVVGLTHPGPAHEPYTVAEYKNMVGRAGRLGITEKGESYLVPEGRLDAYSAWSKYVRGNPEDLTSLLVDDGDPRSLILRVMAAYPADERGTIGEGELIEFLDSSFAAFRAREGSQRAQWQRDDLRRALEQLVSHGLLERVDERYKLSALGRFAGESGTHVESILRLVEIIRRAGRDLNSATLIAATQVTKELDDTYIPLNGRGASTEAETWSQLLRAQDVPQAVISFLISNARDTYSAAARVKRAAASLYWANGVSTPKVESALGRHMPTSTFTGAVRGVGDRTRDLLPAVGAVVTSLYPERAIADLITRTQLRLELGIPAELVELASKSKVELSRQEWLALKEAGLVSPSLVKDAGEDRVGAVLGLTDKAKHLIEGLKDDVLGDLPKLAPATE